MSNIYLFLTNIFQRLELKLNFLFTFYRLIRMNMKKRSLSSLRSKGQDDQSEVNYWIGNLQAQKILSKANQKIALSMMQNNKQNQQVNISSVNLAISKFDTPICQSECQPDNSVIYTPIGKNNKNNNKSEGKDPKQLVINGLQQRCKKLEKQLSQIYSQQSKLQQSNDQQTIPNSKQGQSLQQSTNRQYQPLSLFPPIPGSQHSFIERFYEIELEEMKKEKAKMIGQLDKYRQMYSSKKQELQDLSEGISSRIEKQCIEKNVLIKQINTNNIEIKRLRQQINLHKSEKQALKIILKQKEVIIGQLNTSIGQVEIKRKKIQGYEIQLRESQTALNQIEIQMTKLKTETEKKDAVIHNTNKKVIALQAKLLQYQEQFSKLEKSIISARQTSTESSLKLKQIQQQCQEWKNKYCEVKQQVQQIPQLQTKLKNTQQTIDDLQMRIKQHVLVNQKLKIQLGCIQTLKNKGSEQEKEIINLKKILREKCQQLEATQNSNAVNNGLHREIEAYRIKINELEGEVQQKQQELRMAKCKVQEKKHKINTLQQELEQSVKERIRIKELQLKIDTLFSQNQKLHCSLLEKIGEIQDLQIKLNTLQSKNVTLSNQCTKLKAMNDATSAQLGEVQSKLQNMTNRWQSEMVAKVGLQQKCNRLSKQVMMHKSKAEGLEETSKVLREKSEGIIIELQEEKKERTLQIEKMLVQKKQNSTQIQLLSNKIWQLQSEIEKHLVQQKESNYRIEQLEGNVVDLKKKVAQIQYSKKMWTQVQDIAAKALTELK